LKTSLIDTALFATLGPASSQKSGLRPWLDAHREPVFLSPASLVEIEAAIGRVPASQQARIRALRDWLDGLVSAFSDRIHPLDVTPFARANSLTIAMPDLPDTASMTRCLSRPLRCMAMACSRNKTRCSGHRLRSRWLLPELAQTGKTRPARRPHRMRALRSSRALCPRPTVRAGTPPGPGSPVRSACRPGPD
jgi:hypothetical protein